MGSKSICLLRDGINVTTIDLGVAELGRCLTYRAVVGTRLAGAPT
jgi:hypothetical protein